MDLENDGKDNNEVNFIIYRFKKKKRILRKETKEGWAMMTSKELYELYNEPPTY